MRFREESTLGWGLLELVGQICLPSVTADAQKRAEARSQLQAQRRDAAIERAASMPNLAIRFEGGRAYAVADGIPPRAVREYLRDTLPQPCPKCGGPLGGAFGQVCMNCDVAEPEVTVTTYRADEAFWWLSYANDHGCAGVAIVRLEGEQTSERAAERARQLGLEPQGEWEIAAIMAPEEERALMAAHADRFLTTTEAEAAFQAKALKTWEAENPGQEIDMTGIGVLRAKGEP